MRQHAPGLGDCPRCGDSLGLYHSHDGRPHHFLGCASYPACSYAAPYDEPLHDQLASMHSRLTHLDARLVWLEAQYAWLLCQVEHLTASMQGVRP